METSMGEKIKKLRKDKKMTQTDLAGSEMTKSMLSQIENNLTMPSMKNLQYLAFRLGKPASYFIEDQLKQNDSIEEEIQEELKEAARLLSEDKAEEAQNRLERMTKNYNLEQDSKLNADLLAKYGECFIELNNFELGKEKIEEAVAIYKNKFQYIEAAKSYYLLIGIPWNDFDYIKCVEILEEAIAIYKCSLNKDYAFEIEILYMRSILCTSLDQLEEGILATTQALEISNRTKIYYRSDEFYKIMAVLNLFLDKTEHLNEYLDKARQFATFTENYAVLSSIESILGIYNNQLGEHEKAIEHLNKALEVSKAIGAFVYPELAKTYYLMKQYQLSLDMIALMQYPNYTPLKYDYLILWSSKTYEGLSLNKLGRSKEAIEAIKQGIEKMEIVGNSKTLAFAFRSLSEIYSDIEDYENAFTALKRANEISDIAKTSNLYY